MEETLVICFLLLQHEVTIGSLYILAVLLSYGIKGAQAPALFTGTCK